MELFAINSRGGIFTKLALIVLLYNPEYQLLTSLASTLAFVQVAFHKLTRGQFRGRLLMFFARSFKVSGIRFGQTFNSQSTLMVVLYPKISVFHMGICR